MKFWNSIEEMKNDCNGSFEISGDSLNVKDEARFRSHEVDLLVYNAVFGTNAHVRDAARWVIWEASQKLGCPSSSIHDFYMARAKDLWKGMTVPAINLRGLTYDTARVIFKSLRRHKASACLFEIAKSEMNYTDQRPSEYVACVLGAALKENWRAPVFIQGDHFQVNAKKFAAGKDAEVKGLKDLISEAVESGFYNIDIDTSTLVDLSKPNVTEQQRANFETAAELTKHVRACEPKGITISVGGEIGEVGTQNSTPEELAAFMNGYNASLGNGIAGISKISIQTGTSHGGVPLPDGSIASVKLDFGVIDRLGDMARKEFGIGGVVQHGASTLPESAFDNFPRHQAMEVHLATGFQNTVLDSTNFPKTLKAQIYKWLDVNAKDERKPDMSDEQFYYKSRKKAYGPFKKEMWFLPDNTKQSLMSELTRQFEMLFTKLAIEGNAALIEKYIKPVAVHHPFPKSAKEVKATLGPDDNPNAD